MTTKVAVWGVFDNLHPRHIEFLRKAKALGDELYVVVIPDLFVKENKKYLPANNSAERRKKLLNLDFVKDAYVDCLTYGLESILNLKPDIFAFSHDQKSKWEAQLKDYLDRHSLFPKYVHMSVYNEDKHGSNGSDLEK
jgi:FAD synthetase